MPLTLVTGPANAEKAGVVMDRLRASLDREPILVVPTFPDVERYRRELADEGLVFGARVETFKRLLGEMARRAGAAAQPLGPLARERVAAVAARDAHLEALAASAATSGFAGAACRLFDELEEARIEPARWTRALRDWVTAGGESDPARSRYADELASLYRAYRARLEQLGRTDDTLATAATLDALREAPARWGATPVLFYGFDDLTALQRDAVLTLAAGESEVTVSLAYEPGRHAFAARGEAVADLAPAATERIALEPRAEHYAQRSRQALHHLERGLFEAPSSELSLFDPPPVVDAGDAIVLLEGGGERSELELVAAEAARLIREEGVPPDEIAVVLRRPDDVAALVTQVFDACGVPIALPERTTFGHTPLGRGLLALVRAATGGSAADLLTWLKTPGLVRNRGLVDRLERDVRQTGARTAAEARERWEKRTPGFPLEALDRIADAQGRGPKALLERVADELSLLFAAPHRRQAPVLDGPEAADARVLAAGRRALADLADLAAAEPEMAPSAEELCAALEGMKVFVGERAAAGAVAVADPLSLRARRVQALFVCGLQEGAFPAPARPEPFLDDAERRRVNAASGLRLRAHEDAIAAERYLFYATVSRPEALLYLCWHAASDEGDPVVRSAFVDDVTLLFGDGVAHRRRDLGAVGWPGAAAPAEREALRAEAFAAERVREAPASALSHPAVVASLRERPSWSASGLEAWAGCPVKWFVERLLRPDGLEPDPEMMIRGGLAHAVLERAIRSLVNGGGLTPDRLPLARDAVRSALDDLEQEFPMSTDPARRRAMRRRLEADLLRYLDAAAASGTEFVPSEFEVTFEGLDVGDGVVIGGTVDRIDVRRGGREALLYDYKGKTAPPGAKWLEERRFQLALYALAARRLLGLEPVGALYQPLGAEDLRPRGAVIEDADPDLAMVGSDRIDGEAFDRLVEEAVAAAADAAREAREGRLEPRPDTCAWEGGCAFPTICRCEAAS